MVNKNNLFYNDEFDVDLKKWCIRYVDSPYKQKVLDEFVKWYLKLYLRVYKNLGCESQIEESKLLNLLEWRIRNNTEFFEYCVLTDRSYIQNLKDNSQRDQRKITRNPMLYTWYFSRLHPHFYDNFEDYK